MQWGLGGTTRRALASFRARETRTTFVLDSSAILTWVYLDEVTPAIEQLGDRLNEDDAWVANLWALEIGNNLLIAMRHGRIGEDQRGPS